MMRRIARFLLALVVVIVAYIVGWIAGVQLDRYSFHRGVPSDMRAVIEDGCEWLYYVDQGGKSPRDAVVYEIGRFPRLNDAGEQICRSERRQ